MKRKTAPKPLTCAEAGPDDWDAWLGATVRLKSGGPLLTVVDFDLDGSLEVAWFCRNGGLHRGEWFPNQALERVTEDELPF